jgi:flagellin-like protein
MNKHFNNRAVSEIVAALLLIAIAVAAAVLLYVFSIGLLGSLGSSGGQQTKEQVIMEAYSFPAGGSLTVQLRNVGSASENLANADFFVNGSKSTSASGCPSAVTPSGSCQEVVGVTTTSLISGAAYPFKIVTPTSMPGGTFSSATLRICILRTDFFSPEKPPAFLNARKLLMTSLTPRSSSCW